MKKRSPDTYAETANTTSVNASMTALPVAILTAKATDCTQNTMTDAMTLQNADMTALANGVGVTEFTVALFYGIIVVKENIGNGEYVMNTIQMVTNNYLFVT